jgi:anti-sigma factor RsiW
MKHINHSLPDFIAGALTEAEQATVKEHLADCPTCTAEYEKLQQTFAFLKQSHVVVPDPTYFPNLLPSIRQRQNKKAFFWRLIWKNTTRLALPSSAVALIVIFIILLSSSGNTSVDSSGIRAVMTNLQNDELNDIAVEQDKTALVGDNHELASTIVDEHLTQNHVMKEALLSDAGTEILNDIELGKTLNEFDSDQLDKLLARLGERDNL